jgi:HEAT repeat protein
MRGFSMRFRASGRGDGRPDIEAIKRDEIAKALRTGGAASVQALAQELKSPDLLMRKNAVFELLELGGVVSVVPKIDIKEAVPALIEALNDSDYEVRIWSMAALGSLGPAAKEALPALKQATKDKDEGIRGSAKAGIAQIETGHTGLRRGP